ncbi:peptidoglycan-binding protein [Agromyces sp. NPDC058126]|uniref:peptidoglycan-binding domain-containing protein n=1 Tax=Agromyces sp. NPDC058126 TaxID=3346350 RepID=UPI0036DD22BA
MNPTSDETTARLIRARRLAARVGGSIGILVAGAAIGWAGAAVFVPPEDVLVKTQYTYVELVDGEVGSSISLNTTAEWPQRPVGTNQAVGTVTSVSVEPGDEVKPGQVLYAVNLRPVVVAEGSTPAFRALTRGSEGADVRQLQQLLASLSFYGGEVDGEFGGATEQAVRDWQESLGIDDDGYVQAGDLVFVPKLPGRVALDPEFVYRGAILAGGEAAVSGLAGDPSFTIAATPEQAAMMPAGTRVELSIGDGVWVGFAASQESDPESPDTIRVALAGKEEGPLCSADCGIVPIVGQTLLESTIVTQEPVSGVVVPSSALRSSADGRVSVVDRAGEAHPVSVVASARGMSVIDGATAGMRVRVPADTAAVK